MYGAKQSADASRYGATQSRVGAENVASTQAGASMYGAKQSADASRYGSAKAADASMYGAKQSADASRYGATQSRLGAENVATTQAGSANYQADQARKASMYGADRTFDATKDTNLTSTKNIKVTGDETRQTMGYQDQLDASKANRQSARSRSMARAF